MVARGDLGVEIPMETLTNVQKDLVRRSNLAGNGDCSNATEEKECPSYKYGGAY